MERLKKIVHRLLFPATAIVILSVPVATAMLLYTFLVAGKDSPISYISYIVSAYALTIVCLSLTSLIRKANQWIRKILMSAAI